MIAGLLGWLIALALLGAQVALVVWVIHMKAFWVLVAWVALALSASKWAVDVIDRMIAWTHAGRGVGLALRRAVLPIALAVLMSLLMIGAFGEWHPPLRGRR